MFRFMGAGMMLLALSSGSFAASAMEVRGPAFPPPAFNQFCRQQPSICSTSAGTRTVKLSKSLKKELESVNASVNRRIREQSDIKSSGREDYWRVPTKVGDCEDFAILKKRELMARGWPSAALLLTVVTARGTGHTVLTVRTDAGDLILDNKTTRIKNWSRTGYNYFARQAQGSGSKWQRIGGAVQLESSALDM